MDDEDVEILRLGLWALFATASIHRADSRLRPYETYTVPQAAIVEADELLRAAEARHEWLRRPAVSQPDLLA